MRDLAATQRTQRTLQDVVQAGRAVGVGARGDAVELLLESARRAQQTYLQLCHCHPLPNCLTVTPYRQQRHYRETTCQALQARA